MSLYTDILYYLSAPKCVCCGNRLERSERALCKKCHDGYLETKSLAKCSHCLHDFTECTCSNDYLNTHYIRKLIKLFRYTPSSSPDEHLPANQLIYIAKRHKRIDLFDFLSDELSRSIKANIKYDGYLVTNVPRDKKRKVEYGFDHSEVLAREVAKKLGLKYVKVLKSKSKKAQKKVKGEERIRNATFDYLKRIPDLSGQNIILIDDISTTGASLGNSAMLIKGLGAKKIVGACIAVTFKDMYKPFQ